MKPNFYLFICPLFSFYVCKCVCACVYSGVSGTHDSSYEKFCRHFYFQYHFVLMVLYSFLCILIMMFSLGRSIWVVYEIFHKDLALEFIFPLLNIIKIPSFLSKRVFELVTKPEKNEFHSLNAQMFSIFLILTGSMPF